MTNVAQPTAAPIDYAGIEHSNFSSCGLPLLVTLLASSVETAFAGQSADSARPGSALYLAAMNSGAGEISGFSLKLGVSAGILLCAGLLAASLWRYCGGQRYRYALGYYCCIGLILGVTGMADNADMWLLDPARISLLLLSLASIAGAALCLALLYPYQPLNFVRRSLQFALAINALVLVATAGIFSLKTAAFACVSSAMGTCLVAAVASGVCSWQQPKTGLHPQSQDWQLRPLLLFGCSWLAIAGGLLVFILPAAPIAAFRGAQGNALLTGLDLQLLLMSAALLDQAWLEYRDHLQFHLQAGEQARHSSSQLRARFQKLTRHNQELSEMLRQGDRLDPASGLLSARALHRELDREHKTAVRYGMALSVIVVQLDQPLTCDDEDDASTAPAGIATLARLVSSSLQRPGDIGGRITSNRIAVVLPYTGTAGARHVIERIRQGTGEASPDQTFQGTDLHFGVASTETQLARHADDLLETAMGQVGEKLSQPG